jgi:outer membrane protein OmpA-like peptidoglycan-associated protein
MLFNSRLSRDRSLALAFVLSNQNVPSNRITCSGRGFAGPAAMNSTASRRVPDRRVAIIFVCGSCVK